MGSVKFLFIAILTWAEANAFCPHSPLTARSRLPVHLGARKTLVKESSFDPLGLADEFDHVNPPKLGSLATVAAASTALAVPSTANAMDSIISTGSMDPTRFNPVCPASDGIYRFLQTSTTSVVGEENFVEYGPLISGGLLRIRLELCVIESFFKEAIGPFIKQNGIGWIFPLHETVETFLAGVIFALATTFILIGSTKLVTVLLVYLDLLLGAPARLFGGFAFDRARGKPVTLDLGFGPFKRRVIGPPDDEDSGEPKRETNAEISPAGLVVLVLSGAAKYAGQGIGVSYRQQRHQLLEISFLTRALKKVVREGLEAVDYFVGRYLVVGATGYILVKFVHFKVFPDFP